MLIGFDFVINRLARTQIHATVIPAGQVTIVRRRPTFPTRILRTETTSARPLWPPHRHPELILPRKLLRAKPVKASPLNTVIFSLYPVFHLNNIINHQSNHIVWMIIINTSAVELSLIGRHLYLLLSGHITVAISVCFDIMMMEIGWQ